MNTSKANDNRFKKIWKASGAIGPKTNKIELPGAENFSKYLEQKYGFTISVEGIDPKDGAKIYLVKRYNKIIGIYSVYEPRPGETDFVRDFEGRLPGYVNDVLARRNKKLPKYLLPFADKARKKPPVDSVSLTWANEKWRVCGGFEEALGQYWYRHDRHEVIPFP
ncbi:MAG: hypothetical protein M0R80_02490 [Proteobacteria bacterium]|jgi:hypothetical protein|nr:hypothetical protein [Pseudomonadota bacterium]